MLSRQLAPQTTGNILEKEKRKKKNPEGFDSLNREAA